MEGQGHEMGKLGVSRIKERGEQAILKTERLEEVVERRKNRDRKKNNDTTMGEKKIL